MEVGEKRAILEKWIGGRDSGALPRNSRSECRYLRRHTMEWAWGREFINPVDAADQLLLQL
jgi:hypothetical protein